MIGIALLLKAQSQIVIYRNNKTKQDCCLYSIKTNKYALRQYLSFQTLFVLRSNFISLVK